MPWTPPAAHSRRDPPVLLSLLLSAGSPLNVGVSRWSSCCHASDRRLRITDARRRIAVGRWPRHLPTVGLVGRCYLWYVTVALASGCRRWRYGGWSRWAPGEAASADDGGDDASAA
jgi:hypothetical protein